MAEFKRRPSGKFGGRNSRKGGRSNGRGDSGRSEGRFNRGSRFGRRDKPEMTEVTCSACKKKCEVPFKPTSSKPVYCSDCFKKDSNPPKSSGSVDLTEINQKLDKIIKALKIE